MRPKERTKMSLLPGFDFEEARQCLALSADVETFSPSTADAATQAAIASNRQTDPNRKSWPFPVPGIGDWEIVVDPTHSIGLDNYWRLYRSKTHEGRYAAAVRGTVANPSSVLADVMLGMLEAQGTLRIHESAGVPGYDFDFRLADDGDAGVHHGFTYSLGALLNPTWQYGIAGSMNAAIAAGATEFLITGHSQGAAIATLLRSYLHYQPLAGEVTYKTYVFAQPKPGNAYMGADFERLFATPALAYRLYNTLDWVPQTGFTIELPSDVPLPNPLSVVPHLIDEVLREIVEKILAWMRKKARKHETLGRGTDEVRLAIGQDLISAYYAGMANPIALRGDPQVGNDHDTDMFAQHHLGTYWALMKAQLRDHK